MQEDLLDKKKQEREKFGSVNLKADEETSKYETEIKKMEQDRADLVTAIIKLKESINELYTWIDRSTYQPIDMVKQYEAAVAFGIYAKERDWVIGESIKAGATAESFQSSRKLLSLRNHLRNVANSLIIQYPDFEPLYRSILEVELKDELSDTLIGVGG